MTKRNARGVARGLVRVAKRAAKRVLNAPGTVLRGARPHRRPHGAIKMRLTFDGGARLNWSTSDLDVEGLAWASELAPEHGGHSPAARRSDGAQGFIDLPAALGAGAVQLRAVVGEHRLPISALKEPHDAKMSNVGRTRDGKRLVVGKGSDGAAAVFVQDELEGPPYVKAVLVGVGTLRMEFGAVPGSAHVALRARKSGRELPFTQGVRDESALTVELRRTHLAHLFEGHQPGSEAEKSVWDVVVNTEGGRLRPTWGGSQLSVPRESLRFVATSAVIDAERTVTVRPYWTNDQKLAVELAEVRR